MLHWWGLLLALASGYAAFFLITKYVYHVCPACAASHFDEATTHRFSEIAAAMMIALAIHCTADGVALSAGHEAHAANVPGGRALDFSLVLAVCVHKVPEGLALGALLLGAGFSRANTVFRVAAVPAAHIRCLAASGAGPRRRRVFISGCSRGSGRDPQACQGAGADEFCGGLRGGRDFGAGAEDVLNQSKREERGIYAHLCRFTSDVQPRAEACRTLKRHKCRAPPVRYVMA